MKTTLDLPVELVRAMKVQAAQEGRKLRDVAAEVFRRGMDARSTVTTTVKRRRVKLPLVAAPPGAAPFKLSGTRLHELEIAAELKRHDSSFRH